MTPPPTGLPLTLDGRLVSPGGSTGFSLVLCRFDGTGALPDPETLLWPEERSLLGLGVHLRRRRSFLAGRWAAKEALARLTGSAKASEFRIEPGIFGQPVVTWPPGSPQVTLSHGEGVSTAVAFPETHPMGVDVEEVGSDSRTVLEDQLTDREKRYCDGGSWEPSQASTLFWTAKEALSKALRTGLTTPFPVFETEKWEREGPVFQCSFTRFAQYRVWACLVNGRALAVCYPGQCRLVLDGEPVFQALR